ncbi:MAG TPA: hypothetical protein VNC50_13095 [Planctomycetia bacterium]|nr:hypothetical protein [Planctomycetia bacterium]
MQKPAVWICAFALLHVPCATAGGLHLGMKLACKRYGDAWSAGDKPGVAAACAEDFAGVWQLMPDELFAKLPKPSAGEAEVLDSRKGLEEAEVEVKTGEGSVVFQLEGRGFQWLVADLRVRNEADESVSLKHSLAVSLAARNFLAAMNDPASRGFAACCSGEFRSKLARLDAGEWKLVKGYLPSMPEPAPTKRPMVRFHGRTAASMTTKSPTGDGEVALTFVNENGWRIHDLAMRGKGMLIPSFRDSLPALAATAAMGKFLKAPKSLDPAAFVAPGKLLDEFTHLHKGSPPPPPACGDKPEHLRVSHDSRQVYVKYPEKWVMVALDGAEEKSRIALVQLHQGGKWQNASDLLALHRNVQSAGLGWLTQAGFKKAE